MWSMQGIKEGKEKNSNYLTLVGFTRDPGIFITEWTTCRVAMVREKSGENNNFSRSEKSQGIL